MSRALVIAVGVALLIVVVPPVADATFCNLCPPWGIGCAFLDCVGCLDVISIANLISIGSLINIMGVCNCVGVCNIMGVLNVCGILFNGCSCINYGGECAWNILGYLWPLDGCCNWCNILNFFGGRFLVCNLINVMSGLCGLCNFINIASPSMVNILGLFNFISTLYPPFCNLWGVIDILTGINFCNLCFPICFAPLCNVDDPTFWIVLPFLICTAPCWIPILIILLPLSIPFLLLLLIPGALSCVSPCPIWYVLEAVKQQLSKFCPNYQAEELPPQGDEN